MPLEARAAIAQALGTQPEHIEAFLETWGVEPATEQEKEEAAAFSFKKYCEEPRVVVGGALPPPPPLPPTLPGGFPPPPPPLPSLLPVPGLPPAPPAPLLFKPEDEDAAAPRPPLVLPAGFVSVKAVAEVLRRAFKAAAKSDKLDLDAFGLGKPGKGGAKAAAAAAAAATAAVAPGDVESVEETERRFTAGTVKFAIFQALKDVPAEGLTVPEILDKIAAMGHGDALRGKTPKNTVSAACNGDRAFARVSTGRYCLRCLPGVAEVAPPPTAPFREGLGFGPSAGASMPALRSGAVDTSTPRGCAFQLHYAKQEILAELERIRGGRMDPNEPACHVCEQGCVAPTAEVPWQRRHLLGCDYCTRSVHPACYPALCTEGRAEVAWADLQARAEIVCAECAEKFREVGARLRELGAQRQECVKKVLALEREAYRAKAALRPPKPEPTPPPPKAAKPERKAKEPAAPKPPPPPKPKPVVHRYPLPESEALEDEARLLQMLEERRAGGGDAGEPTPAPAAPAPVLEEQKPGDAFEATPAPGPGLGLEEEPDVIYIGLESDPALQLQGAALDREIARIQGVLAGPPDSFLPFRLPHILIGAGSPEERARAAALEQMVAAKGMPPALVEDLLEDVLHIAEFSHVFGPLLDTPPITAARLLWALLDPAAPSPLFDRAVLELYQALLLNLIYDALQRYTGALTAMQKEALNIQFKEAPGGGGIYLTQSSFIAASRFKRFARLLDASSLPEVLRRYLLATRQQFHSIPPEYLRAKDEQRSLEGIWDAVMGDAGLAEVPGLPMDVFSVQAAAVLELTPMTALSARGHLKLLRLLVDDLEGSKVFRTELDKGINEKPEAGEGPAAGPGKTGPGKGGRWGAGGKPPAKAPKVEDLDTPRGSPEPGLDGEPSTSAAAARGPKGRSELLGYDRRDRRFSLLGCVPGVVLVQGDGLPGLHHIADPGTLDALLASLTTKGLQEGELEKGLRRHLAHIRAAFDQRAAAPFPPTPAPDRVPAPDPSPSARHAPATVRLLKLAAEKMAIVGANSLRVGHELPKKLSAAQYRADLLSCETAAELCNELFKLEECLASMGQGLPFQAQTSLQQLQDAILRGEVDQPQSLGYKASVVQHEDGSTATVNLAFMRPSEEVDDSDTETATKKGRKILWRSARERCVWLKEVHRAQRSDRPALAAYCAAVLADRCHPMLEHTLRALRAPVPVPAAPKPIILKIKKTPAAAAAVPGGVGALPPPPGGALPPLPGMSGVPFLAPAPGGGMQLPAGLAPPPPELLASIRAQFPAGGGSAGGALLPDALVAPPPAGPAGPAPALNGLPPPVPSPVPAPTPAPEPEPEPEPVPAPAVPEAPPARTFDEQLELPFVPLKVGPHIAKIYAACNRDPKDGSTRAKPLGRPPGSGKKISLDNDGTFDAFCYGCGQAGDNMLTCDVPGCTKAAHFHCAGLHDAPMGDWICAPCLAKGVTQETLEAQRDRLKMKKRAAKAGGKKRKKAHDSDSD